jgi:very-short-patch-repair endonuclease
MPPAEQLVWTRLKSRQVEDCKFRRQYSVGAFVIDFYIVEIKLAIEIDGDSHFCDGAEVYDSHSERLRPRERQSLIEAHNIMFLRFTNWQVYEDLDAVVESISQMVCALRELPHPSPPLIKRLAPRGFPAQGSETRQGREPEKPPCLVQMRREPPRGCIRFIRGVGG